MHLHQACNSLNDDAFLFDNATMFSSGDLVFSFHNLFPQWSLFVLFSSISQSLPWQQSNSPEEKELFKLKCSRTSIESPLRLLSLLHFREASVHQTAGEPGGVGRRYSGLLLRGARGPDSDCPLAERGGRAAPGQVRHKGHSCVVC